MNPLKAPWRYAPEGDTDGYTIGIDHIVLDCEGQQVCVAPTAEAARLIASAPRLLEACQDAFESFDDTDMLTDAPAIITIREAIAEATGAA